MTIADKVYENMMKTVKNHAVDIAFLDLYAKNVAPLLEDLTDDCKLLTDMSNGPHYIWTLDIKMEYLGDALNDTDIQPFLRKVEGIFEKGPADWDFILDTHYGSRYSDNHNYCGVYQLNLGDMGFKQTQGWKGLDLLIIVPWLPPCAKEFHNVETVVKDEWSYVC